MIITFMCKRILYIFVLFHFNRLITSYIIIDTNDLLDPNFVQDVVNNYELEDDNVADADFNIKRPRFQDNDEIISENEEKEQRNVYMKGDHENNNYRNKLLVKRIIPHGIALSSIEYDHKFKTAYKPLVRVHKRKTINQFFDEIQEKKKKHGSFRNKDSNHEKSIFISPNRDEYKKFKQPYDLNDKDLLEPFEISKNDFHNKGNGLDFVKRIQKKLRDTKSAESYESFEIKNNLDLINDERLQLVKKIQKKIKGIKSESKRLNAYAKFIDVLNKMLRSPQFEKSGEANDPLAPGKTVLPDDHVEDTKPKKWMPHYPPWNYWTYKKTIHEDVCPGTQVKIGNMCIWTPPH